VNQWISPDPILANFMGGAPNNGVYQPRHLGLYTYTINNPVVLRDPSGLVERDLFSDTRAIRADQRARGIEFEMTSGEKVIAGVTIGLGLVLTLGLAEVPVAVLGAKSAAVALTAETAADFVQLSGAMVEAAANPNFQSLAGVGMAAGDLMSGPGFTAELNTARMVATGNATGVVTRGGGGGADIVYRAPRLGPTGPAGPNVAKTPGEHLLGGGERLAGSPFESWTANREVAEAFARARGTTVIELDLRTVPGRIAADLRTAQGRAAAAAAESDPFIQGLIRASKNDAEVILRR
jgi:hypothetical protein